MAKKKAIKTSEQALPKALREEALSEVNRCIVHLSEAIRCAENVGELIYDDASDADYSFQVDVKFMLRTTHRLAARFRDKLNNCK